jgi:hypothetical protein
MSELTNDEKLILLQHRIEREWALAKIEMTSLVGKIVYSDKVTEDEVLGSSVRAVAMRAALGDLLKTLDGIPWISEEEEDE